MLVEYIDHMGSDLTVVNAARVSFDKHHSEFQTNDEKLIKYLATHGHWTPFAHPQIQLRITVPIFLANQLKRHQIGLVVNEVSRRYVDSEPEFYIPSKFGKRAENKKQGAKEDEFIDDLVIDHDWCETPTEFMQKAVRHSVWLYNKLLSNGVAPEDARMVLPLATYTSWYWTGSLSAYARLYNLRSKIDTQRQNRQVADMIGDIIEPLFPVSWRALKI